MASRRDFLKVLAAAIVIYGADQLLEGLLKVEKISKAAREIKELKEKARREAPKEWVAELGLANIVDHGKWLLENLIDEWRSKIEFIEKEDWDSSDVVEYLRVAGRIADVLNDIGLKVDVLRDLSLDEKLGVISRDTRERIMRDYENLRRVMEVVEENRGVLIHADIGKKVVFEPPTPNTLGIMAILGKTGVITGVTRWIEKSLETEVSRREALIILGSAPFAVFSGSLLEELGNTAEKGCLHTRYL